MARDRDEYGEPRVRNPRDSRGGNRGFVIGAVAVLVLAVVGGAVWYFATGETTDDVIAKYRARFADVRAKLKRVADKLPPRGSVAGDTLPANLNPKPVFDVPNKRFNTAIIMAEQCADADRNPKSPGEFTLQFHEDGFLAQLAWTGDRNPMAESARKSSAGDLAERFEQSLRFAYLVVARPVMFDPPRQLDENTFVGAVVDLEVFLVDLPGEKVLGGFRRTFRPDPNVMVTFRKDRKDSESVENWVYSNMWSKARTEVAATLARATGGTFAIER